MRPENKNGNRWTIRHEIWYPTKKEASDSARRLDSPYDIDYVSNAKTMYGNYRKNNWRLRTYRPVMYHNKRVQTGGMSHGQAVGVAKYHRNRKLVKIRKLYYYI
jgi:glutamate synthase domain-containing protein 2